MAKDQVRNIARIIGGALAIVQASVLINAHFGDPWKWVVPTGFAVAVYIVGEVAGAAANSVSLMRTNRIKPKVK